MTNLNSDIWQNNLKILKTYYPKLNDQFIEHETTFLNKIKFEKTKSDFTYVSILRENTYLPLHSKIDPFKESIKFIDSQNLSQTDDIIIFGLGLGYHLKELLSRKNNNTFIIVVESDLLAFFSFCKIFDISFLLSTKGLHFLFNPTMEDFFSYLLQFSFSIVANGIKIIKHGASIKFNLSYYNDLNNKVQDFQKWAKANILTQVNAATTFSGNVFSNLKHIVNSIPIKIFKDKFKNIPIIIVSGGPSLAKNGYLLKKFKDKFLIISVDTATNFLYQTGIEPDFILTLDFTKNATDYFDKNRKYNSILIADPEVCPEIVSNYNGLISFCDAEGKSIGEWYRKSIGEYGIIQKGMSVAHMALSVALYFGGTTIIFVGQDLGYSNNRTHVKGASHGVNLKSESGDLIIQGLFGKISTSNNLKLFLDHFVDMISKLDVQIINATEGGALIKNTQNMTLREVLFKVKTYNTPINLIIKSIIDQFTNTVDKNKFIEFLKNTINQINSLNSLVKSLCESLSKIIILINTNNPSKESLLLNYNKYLFDINQLSKFQDILELLRDNMTFAYIIKAKRFSKNICDIDLLKDKDLASEIFSSNKIYYTYVETTSNTIKEQIYKTLEELEKS